MKSCIGGQQLNKEMSGICGYGNWNKLFLDKICALLFVISPLLQHYKGLYQNAGFTSYLVLIPWLVIRLFQEIKCGHARVRCIVTLPLILFFVYSAIIHEITVSKILYSGFMIVMCILLEFGCFNLRYIYKYATLVCMLASIILIIQYVCFYLFKFHLCVVPTEALLAESSSWIAGAKTGLINIRGGSNGFYRPSAFFLEPSHLFIYFFPVLCVFLFSNWMTKFRVRIALLISVGLLLSTSGMGIVCCGGVWLCYFLMYYDKTRENVMRLENIFSARNVLIVSFFCLFVIGLYFTVDSVANTINRVFFDASGAAFTGRFGQASNLIRGMTGSSVLFGLTDDRSNIIFNLPGFFATMYKKGIIGVLLSYWFYVQGLFKLRGAHFWMSVIILILSFFSAHTHGTFYMMFFVAFLLEGYRK